MGLAELQWTLYRRFVCTISTWKFYYRSAKNVHIFNPSGRLNLFIYLSVHIVRVFLLYSWCLFYDLDKIQSVGVGTIPYSGSWFKLNRIAINIRFQLYDLNLASAQLCLSTAILNNSNKKKNLMKIATAAMNDEKENLFPSLLINWILFYCIWCVSYAIAIVNENSSSQLFFNWKGNAEYVQLHDEYHNSSWNFIISFDMLQKVRTQRIVSVIICFY